MKVIELLNKIANGEEVPKKIKKNWIYIWTYDEIREQFTYMQETGERFDENWLIESMLNDEVEIIEEPQEHKIPEKIDQWDRQWHYTYYKKEQLNQMQDNIEQLRQKYNKIIDYLEEIE